MFDKKIVKVYSIICGIFFIFSGIGKVADTTSFSQLIYQYGLGYLMVLAPVIALAEVAIGLCLLLQINPRLFAFLAAIFLMVFTLLFAYAHVRWGVNNCGCFGTLAHADLPPFFTFFRNSILLLMSWIVYTKYPIQKETSRVWKKVVFQLILYPAIFFAGFSFTTPFFLKSKISQHPFQNKNINSTPLSKYITTSVDSTYLIFCFSYTCPHCWNSIENLRQYKKTNMVDRIVTLATGDLPDRENFTKNFNPDFYVKDIPLPEMTHLALVFPTAFYVTRDTIKVIVQSSLPSPVTFKKEHQLISSL